MNVEVSKIVRKMVIKLCQKLTLFDDLSQAIGIAQTSIAPIIVPP